MYIIVIFDSKEYSVLRWAYHILFRGKDDLAAV